jgi:hypothetical protein
MFDIFYIGRNDQLAEKMPFARQIGSADQVNPLTKMYWLIDANIQILDYGIFDFRPSEYEHHYLHTWLWRENQFGGVQLVPKNHNQGIKEHPRQVCRKVYDVLYTQDPGNYFEENNWAEHVWCIDPDYQIDLDAMEWSPPLGEEQFAHNFRLPNQLTHRYVEHMGGITLYSPTWRTDQLKIHAVCPFEDVRYPVYRIPHAEFNAAALKKLAKNSVSEWFWAVDQDHSVNADFVFVPDQFEQQYIHIFKIPGQLTERYPANITQEWDARAGGAWLINRNFDFEQRKFHPGVLPLRYNVFLTDDVNNLGDYAARSRTQMFWLIDRDYVIDHNNIAWIPEQYDQGCINIFKIHGQLDHKYPAGITNVSDNRAGGVKLVPRDYQCAESKYQGYLEGYALTEWEKFSTEDEGRANSKHDWFWVIDPYVDVLEEFDFNFIPEKWDEGKTHMWQKINPVTGRQYDYGGVMLCHKTPVAKGRPKYMRFPACVQKPFAVHHLDASRDIVSQLCDIDKNTHNHMFWAVDPYTKINPDFNFDYYPTQWDKDTVHVFADQDGAYRNIRLYPTGTFSTSTVTAQQVSDNSFVKLKQINNVGSLRPQWPAVTLKTLSRAELLESIQESSNQGEPFLWTIDPDVSVEQTILDAGYLPDLPNVRKVHVWQRSNPHTGQAHSYGGLRLWPTDVDHSSITTDALRLNKIKSLQYVKQTGSTYRPYDIVFLSYKEPGASSAYKRLTARFPAVWVKDVTGIFEAHKAAANAANSTMFWIVDADADVVEDFDFSYIPDVYDQDVTHVWASRNPVTGAEYGYGGVKLLNRQQVLQSSSWGLDFTTGLSKRFKAMPAVSCVTRFNTDELSTWRSAFRECVKLTLKDDVESRERLQSWLNPIPAASFANEAKRGAEEGCAYAQKNRNDLTALGLINNYDWLEQRYKDGF